MSARGDLLAAADSVSVIIPARDEAHNLPTLLRSLSESSVRCEEIIVVDDGSTDGTAEVAREYGATVIASESVPDGWRGKTWACHQGARQASGKRLLFLDADTWFETDGLNRALAGHRSGAFSVGPFHAVQDAYEDLSLFFNLAMNLGTLPDGLFGQMLLVDRDSYGRVGGHEAVKGKILENVWLAEAFRQAGVTVGSAPGRNVFSFRMYPNGWRDLVEGWTKGFASGANRTPGSTLVLIVLWMIGLMLAPMGGVMTGELLPWAALYALCAVQLGWFGRRVGAFRLVSVLFYPVPLIFFFAVFFWSAMRSQKTVTWKGRKIRAD